ncbi:hypothetical protein AGOR_G00139920 [Albula goreensis]|uniref:Ig-like domain-containing protein n=1 Tax=Albula goreensis TaxID=1534307 RepID=A0A8T3D648_9TELE|nr:hypothetical protein AGOR_G00139920 [Albula goreensis]
MKLNSFLLMTLLVAAFNFTKQAGTAQVTLTSDPPWLEVFRGEPITLRCTIKKSEEHISWTYTWKKQEYNGQVQVLYADGGAPTFPLDHPIEAGMIRYWCEANNGTMSIDSNPIILKVIDEKPKPVITQDPPSVEVYTGERVTLSCGFGGDPAGWEYLWYKDTQGAALPNTDSSRTDGSSYTISSAALTHSGEYRCIASRGPFYSHFSDSLTLKISDKKPKPVITQDPPGAEVYTGERVTLSCGFGGDPAGWEYLWYKDTQGAALPNTDSSRTDGSSYTISSAALSHSGQYWCRAARGRDPFHSNYSDSVVLSIIAHPLTVVTMETGWTEIFTSGSVTLRCEVKGISAEWNYTWYRDGEQIPLDHPGERLTVRIWNSSYWGQYRCRGNRTEKPFYTRTSESFKTTSIMLCCILGLSGSLLFFITMVVLAVKCMRKPGQNIQRCKKGESCSLENAEITSADCTGPVCDDVEINPGAVYDDIEIDPVPHREIDPVPHSEGYQALVGQRSLYSSIQQ